LLPDLRSYLRKFGLEDARHVIFECRRFDEERATLEGVVGAEISVDTLVPLIVMNPRNWDTVAEFSA
ncbi:hypothetical protein KR054_006158, partial [Drosophila jambulina]